jgi:hypothetical protein
VSLDHEAYSEGDEMPDDDLDDEEEFYDCEDQDELEEEEEGARQSTSSHNKRISSASRFSRSPAPEHWENGAQAEENAEVEISEVIALRFSRFSLAHQPSLLIKPNAEGLDHKGMNGRILAPDLKKPDDPEGRQVLSIGYISLKKLLAFSLFFLSR